MNALASRRTVSDMVAEYDEKVASIPDEIKAFDDAVRRIKSVSGIGGVFGSSIFHRGDPSVSERDIKAALLKSAWQAIYRRLNIDAIASATDKKRFDQEMAAPPELTIDNAVATFGDYLERPRHHILRGLAEVFAALDPAYRSHSKVKVGVKALPKRVILSNVGRYGSWGRDQLRDILNALAAYQGKPLVNQIEFQPLDALHRWDGSASGEILFNGTPIPSGRKGEDPFVPPDRGVWLRKFQNGNAHLFFGSAALVDINRALAEFYGEVLPDMATDAPEKPISRAVAKDLQYYPTPEKVISSVLEAAGVHKREGWRETPALSVLEPSCGDGRILDEIARRGHKARGVEIHQGRAQEAKRKGHAVYVGNFLETASAPTFDAVVMNPPFYGTHWRHHLRHALKFLKPGGILVCVLPATAEYDHEVSKEFGGRWEDLPVASFAESGTNVPTGYVRIHKRT